MNKTHINLALVAIGLITALWCHADAVLNTVSQTTTLGSSAITGVALTNNNVNSFVIFTNNGVSVTYNSSGVFTFTNYAGANLGATINTNGIGYFRALGLGATTSSTIGELDLSAGVVMGGAGSGYLQWGSSASRIDCGSDGNLKLSDHNANAFSLLQFGGTTAAYPSLKRSNGDLKLSDGAGTGTTNNFFVPGATTSTNGFGSYAVSTITTSATGATNTTSVNQILYVTAATSATLKDNAGTTEFSGVTIVAFTPIRLQPLGTFIGTSITYATGTSSHAE